MTRSLLRGTRFVAWLAVGAIPLAVLGADGRRSAIAPPAATAEVVDLFDAMKSGDIEAKIIPKNDRQSRVVIKNNTKRPISVRLPDAFAGVPVLAQGGFPFGLNPGALNANNRGNNPANANNANQAIGVNAQPNGNNRRNGFFNLPAEKTGDFKAITVCLEHGKKEPKPSIPYEIRPIEAVTAKPAAQALCVMLGEELIDQRAAQAAAWHLANEMTWEELAAKRIEHLNAASEPYFNSDQLRQAKELAKKAIAAAASRTAVHAGRTATARTIDTRAVTAAARK